ncbi:MAG TPA: fused MFS/spermidine synthase [Bryobacteraceae bacterium]|nr:fused MFS/spermidine synthase [Bryobacteraceae bacterium]
MILAYAGTIFLSAFLLFAVQPMIGKMILPWFGGSAAVWNTCLLFFQAALLAGYLYAHVSTRYLKPKQRAILHAALIIVSLALLPVVPASHWKPLHPGDPSGRILLLLTVTIGLPYTLLAATSPLLQAWYVSLRPGAIPYRLFALSNFGSFLALFSFPVLAEPLLTTHAQAYSWSAMYVVFVLLCSLAAWMAFRAGKEPAASQFTADESSAAPPWQVYLLWIILPGCASALLLAITNHLTQNVAPIPLLWVIPLGIYLLSFILCFERERLYSRTVFLPLLAAGLGISAFAIYYDQGNPDIRWAIPAFVATLFVSCMVCHGELVRLKPDPRHLTSFYLMISLGGALGGLFVAVGAPHWFESYFELDLLLVVSGLLASLVLWIAPGELPVEARNRVARIAALVLWLGAAGYLGYQARHEKWDLSLLIFGALTGLAVWIAPFWSSAIQLRITRIAMPVFTVALAAYLTYAKLDDDRRYVVAVRNYYGVLRVIDVKESPGTLGTRTLVHGNIEHGVQLTRQSLRRTPTSYYGPDSGIGRAIHYFEQRSPVRVGVVGLGAGVTAAYCRAGDFFRFYDINPLVLNLATTWFTFFNDCPGDHQVLLGDARLTMEQQPSQQYDVLAIDAFTGDAIPVHLLTREAVALYLRHLKPGGILAVHVSNRYLDLVPVVARHAADFGKVAMQVSDDGDSEDYFSSSDWILVSADRSVFKDPLFKVAHPAKLQSGLRPWTDDYSNLIQILILRK